MKKQPISAPYDVKRYFVTQKESGELCMMSALLGKNREIFFPKLNSSLDLIKFSDIAQDYLAGLGYDAYICETEDEARKRCAELIEKKKWPCYFFASDTTGEKPYEEFYSENEELEMHILKSIGIIKNNHSFNEQSLENFLVSVQKMKSSNTWRKEEIVEAFSTLLPDFHHIEKGKNLDQRM